MDKLTVHMMSESGDTVGRLYERLLMKIDPGLHNSTVELKKYKDFSEITIGSLKQLQKSGKRQDWVEAVCTVLADYLLQEREEAVLKGMIEREQGIGGGEDQGSILSYCKQLLDAEDELHVPLEVGHGRTRRLKLLCQDLMDYCKESSLLNIDGFLRFRLNRYAAELKEVIEYATDEFLMDQQYKEFISLLKYFVYIQDTKIPEAHLMHRGGHEFVLLNEQMKPIDTEKLDTSFKVEFLDKDFNFEDLIVSTLITLAPERIYLHTREPELAVIKTIGQIFEDRAEVCDYCRLCGPMLGDHGHKDQMST